MSAKSRKGRTIGRPARHGGYSLLTRGVLPEKRKYIGHYLTSVREGLIHDLAAAEEDLSMAQRVLIDRVITFLGVIRLIEEHAREHGILDAKGELTSGLTHHYLSFNRHIKDCLALLGLDRKPGAELTFEQIIAEEEAAASKGEGVQARTEGGGQVQDEGSGAEPSREGKLGGSSGE